VNSFSQIDGSLCVELDHGTSVKAASGKYLEAENKTALQLPEPGRKPAYFLRLSYATSCTSEKPTEH
jgi:hypothetical protein